MPLVIVMVWFHMETPPMVSISNLD